MRRTYPGIFAAILIGAVCAALAPRPAAADGPVHVQIKTIPIAAVSAKGYQGRTTVTPYMTVKSADVLKRLCGRVPVLLDVLAEAFEDEPLKLADIGGDLQSRQQALGKSIEDALGINLFEAIYVLRGGHERGEMTQMIDMDGGTRDCQPIAYLPWARPDGAAEPAQPRQQDIIKSPLSRDDPMAPEAQLSDAELERFLERELKGVFPGAPPKPKGMPVPLITLAVFALTGILLIAGSYIGYQVGKMRRDRRRLDRRKRRKDRRSGKDRRDLDLGPPPGLADRRQGDRRTGDRRTGDRRSGPRGGPKEEPEKIADPEKKEDPDQT